MCALHLILGLLRSAVSKQVFSDFHYERENGQLECILLKLYRELTYEHVDYSRQWNRTSILIIEGGGI